VRTTIVLDDSLVAKALRASGLALGVTAIGVGDLIH